MRRGRSVAPAEMDRLELTIRRLLEAHETVRGRADRAEARVRELEGALQGISTGRFDPVALEDRIRELEAVNSRLRERVTLARAAVDRMRARLQFAEEEQ